MGVLAEKSPGLLSWLRFAGPVAFAWDGLISPEERGTERPMEQYVLTGPLDDGRTLDRVDGAVLDRYRVPGSDRHRFTFFSGAVCEGRLERSVRDRHERLSHLELCDVRLELAERAVELARYRLFAAGEPLTAHAGAVDPSYHGETAFPGVRVPKPRVLPEVERELLSLYERAAKAHAEGAPAMARDFPRVHDALVRSFPDEWLLRWNLLESLLKVKNTGPLGATLKTELERLEEAFDYRQPIASGLRYLAGLA
jgi:hypothetical protein